MSGPTTSEPRRGLPRSPRAALVAAALVVALPLAGLVLMRSIVEAPEQARLPIRLLRQPHPEALSSRVNGGQ